MSTFFITIHLASPVQPNFGAGADRSAIGYEGRGVDCEVSSCAQAILSALLRRNACHDLFSNTRDLSHRAHFVVAQAEPRTASRNNLVKNPLWSTMLSRLWAIESVNICHQLVKHPWQVAGGELPQPPVICVQSKLFGCRSAHTG